MSDPGDTIDSTDEPADTGPHELIYLAAAGEAIMEEMARDDRVVLVGEDIELYGGHTFNIGAHLKEEGINPE